MFSPESFPTLVLGLTLLIKTRENLTLEVKHPLARHKGWEGAVGITASTRFMSHNQGQVKRSLEKRQQRCLDKKPPTNTDPTV